MSNSSIKGIIMKQLLLTFFAVILCYSMFFDKKATNPVVDEINYMNNEVLIPNYHYTFKDSSHYLTFYSGSEIPNKAFESFTIRFE